VARADVVGDGTLAAQKGRRMDAQKDLLEERGGRIDPMKSPEPPMDDDDRIDEAIAESFPASDPPSFNSGVGGD
jgi:hypothetical protein